jgi:hypothetical protein
MKLEEVGKLLDLIVEYYPAFTGTSEKLKAWHDVLRETSYETAKQNLIRYVGDPDNKYAPHPGVLAKRLDAKTDTERYHEHMRYIGINTLEEYERLKHGVAPPTSEQLRKVRGEHG